MSVQSITTDVLLEKYAKNNEQSIDDIYKRVSKGISAKEKEEVREYWENKFYLNMQKGGIGAGRIMSAAGAGIDATLCNCFVQPVGDCIQLTDKNGVMGIYEALRESAETMSKGGGVGYDFSLIRPKNAIVKGTRSMASGPCSYMNIFDSSCSTIESAGCFAGDTLIATTEGLIKVKEIVESDKEYFALTHKGPKKITTKFKNGIKPIWNVTTEYGYNVRVTKDHKFAQFDNGAIVTKSIEEIYFSKNHSLIILTPITESIIPTWSNEEMTAYLVGAFQGNGNWCFNDNKETVKGISISNNTTKEHIVDRILDFATKLGLNPKKSKRPLENTLEVHIFNSEYFRNWKDIEVNKGMEMHVPTFILESSNAVRAAYVAGMMEADGCISETKSNIRLRLITKPLLKDIQVILASLGIPTTLKLEREEIGEWKKLYCLGIYGPVAQERYNKTIGNFKINTLKELATRDRVGFGHSWFNIKPFNFIVSQFQKYWSGNQNTHPNISLNALVNTVTIPELINTISDRIKHIVREEPEETYDLEVEDVHLLSGDGIFTSNSRRGAQMGVLKINHPDILDFITAKRTQGRWNNFNVSVFVTDEFMKAKNDGTEIELIHKAEPSDELKEKGAFQREDGNWVYNKINANQLWDTIMKSNYDYAEPGILFGDNINSDNNLNYCEHLDATNPCGEQPLPPYGCCDLGPIILPKFVSNPFTDKAEFDFETFKDVVTTQIRFLDNVLDVTVWPLEQQRIEAENKRRVGCGFTGLSNALSMLCLHYSSEAGLNMAEKIVTVMRDTAYRASIELAKERGKFPLFNASKYLKEGTFASRLPDDIKKDIRKFGIRNSHLLSIAPTGTISLAFADNASNGIEPPYSLAYTRKKRMADDSKKEYYVVDHALRVYLTTLDKDLSDILLEAICNYRDKIEYKDKVYKIKDILHPALVTALELTPVEHLLMMERVQPFIDSAISKTVNVPIECTFEDFKHIYDIAWVSKLKGVSTYRPNPIVGSVLSLGTSTPVATETPVKANTVSDVDPNAIVISKRPSGRLQSVTDKIQYHGHNGDYTLYVGVSFMNVKGIKDGIEYVVERPIEIFINASPSSVPVEWVTTYARTMSLIARSGLALFTKALQDNRSIASGKHQIRYDWHYKADGTKVPRHHDSDVAVISYAIQNLLKERGILNESGNIAKTKVNKTEVLVENKVIEQKVETVQVNIIPGKICTECGAAAVIRKDGCSYCTACSALGECG